MIPDIYHDSSLQVKINRQKLETPQRLPVCLFTDLDDSYILKYWPSEDILDRLSQKITDTILSPDLRIYEPTIRLKRFLDAKNVPIVAVSGRDLHQMNELKKKFTREMPHYPEIMDFDAIIGAVGTEIYIKSDGSYVMDDRYAGLLEKTRYSREELYSLLSELIPEIKNKFHPVAFDFCKRDRAESTDELPKLRFKISYEFKADEKSARLIENYIAHKLKKHGYGQIKILVSCPYAIDNHINKYNVDMVPLSKDTPINYIKNLLSVTAIVAGDSGNDFDMITKAADCAIIVGNAKSELKEKMAHYRGHAGQKIIICPETLIGPEAILVSFKELCPTRL